MRRIAASLGRSPSTVSREVARHGGRSSYRAIEADVRAGSGRCARSHVVWPAIPSYDGALPRSWRLIGRPSKSLGGSRAIRAKRNAGFSTATTLELRDA
jgi:hypothetical protein